MRALVLALVLLGGCALKTPPAREDIAKQALPNFKVPDAFRGTAQPIEHGWLKSFKDPQLDALIAETLAYNPDLQVAAARVEQAAAQVKLAGATLKPQVNALARGGGGRRRGDPSA